MRYVSMNCPQKLAFFAEDPENRGLYKEFMKKISIITALFLLSGCASYRAIPLETISVSRSWMPWKNQDVTIAARCFNEEDCKHYLDRDVISKGYLPVQISIVNKTEHPYLFSLNRVSLPCARAEEVASQVHTSTVGRAAGYGAAALFFWPFAIPAVVDGLGSAHANERLDFDFASKVAKDQLVEAYAHVNMLMFVPKSCFHPIFTVTLVDLKTSEAREFTVQTSV